MIVILDCNIWIKLTLNGQIDFIADLSDQGIILASCSQLRDEITSVFNRPKFTKFISITNIEIVIELHDLVTTHFSLGKIKKVTTDPKDDYLFALAVKAKAIILLPVMNYCSTLSNIKRLELLRSRKAGNL